MAARRAGAEVRAVGLQGEVVAGVRRIAVLRASGIGDLVFSLPALEALRAAYPEAEIVLLADEWHAALVSSRPSPVDRVLPVPRASGLLLSASPRGDEEAPDSWFAALQRERFDLALQLHGGGRTSNPFVRRLGARLTAGSHTPDAERLDRSLPYVFHHHEVLRCLEVVGLVGARPVVLEPRLAVTEQDVAESEAAVSGDGIVVVHPSATDPRRVWPTERFAHVADGLARRGARVVVTGSSAERDVVEGVVGAMAEPALALAGALSLGGLVGLLARADLLVGNDSGPLHLASAVGTPTVGVFWASSAVNVVPLTRARHRPLLSFRVACPRCSVDQTERLCGHAVSYVGEVRQEEVLAVAEELLGLSPSDPPALARALDWRPGPGLRTVEWER